jgi:hypothetical protein
VRGLNDKDTRLAVYNKIEESNCSVVCLQETKFIPLITLSLGVFVQRDLTDLFSLLLLVPLVEL